VNGFRHGPVMDNPASMSFVSGKVKDDFRRNKSPFHLYWDLDRRQSGVYDPGPEVVATTVLPSQRH
jgi:hypothetical protein